MLYLYSNSYRNDEILNYFSLIESFQRKGTEVQGISKANTERKRPACYSAENGNEEECNGTLLLTNCTRTMLYGCPAIISLFLSLFILYHFYGT